MSQYFTENHAVLTRERLLKLHIFGRDFEFLANNGLFSCDKVDTASILLMENLPSLTGATLDLGCGYGPIGIVLGVVYPVQITMSDVNPIAVEYAARNAARNRVEAQCIYSDGFASLPFIYDNIVLNPPIHAGKDVMYRLYRDAARHLAPGGALYIVIQKKHGAESAIAVLSEIFHECRTLYKKKGLYVLQCVTPE
ncbi:MAG: methyltransferase [Defluviitaleaceae bacterium]|nr:methyltransferase [Defluviitaleaceae bacterium]